ncbi:hypothetical protein [Ornithinimicrobium sufpigmenti]|uniref:recombination directionality factor n=1 Tax=Ornithinimicrobium sufpigmenti TaxID=2508882 RepID=UPI001036E637|nr:MULTISPECIES: hypothetical protein [unclassified Ornithinimicrobium]
MPIINIQRRMAEQGRIRLGVKAPVGNQGKTRPAKLDRFRFTSPNADLIAAIADQYGGQARPWDNGGKPEHEVITDATSVPVIVVKGGLSQWMETWSGGGCIHRCDGETNVLTDAPCDLTEMVQIGRDRVNPHAVAKPTTRLSVMLTEIESLGVWRMETHGWNAAAEIPAMAELAMHVGDLVPATLQLVERRAIRDGKTSRFVVPVLDLHVTKKRLVELVGGVGGQPALEQAAPSEQVAIEAPRPDYAALLADARTPEDCRAVWTLAGDQGDLDDALKAEITKHAQALAVTAEAAQQVADVEQAEQAPVDEPVDAEVVEDEPTQAATDGVDPRTPVWQELLLHAGQRGMSTKDLQGDVEFMRGKSLHDCTVEDLRAVLESYRTGEVPEAATA